MQSEGSPQSWVGSVAVAEGFGVGVVDGVTEALGVAVALGDVGAEALGVADATGAVAFDTGVVAFGTGAALTEVHPDSATRMVAAEATKALVFTSSPLRFASAGESDCRAKLHYSIYG